MASLAGVALIVALTTVVPARATFPGANGRIAFSTDWTRPSQIYTMRANGSGLKQLTHAHDRKGATSPTWSADGTRIAFARDGHIWVMNADSSGKTQVTSDAGFRDKRPSWSPDGTKIVFSHCDVSLGFTSYCDIDSIDSDGSNETTLLGGYWKQDWPAYSPDGSRIVFAGDRGGYVCAVWVMNADGSDPVRLTDPAMQANVPSWSPDGTQIAFGTHCELPGGRVWVMDADGSAQHQVIAEDKADADWGNPRFSPDGLTIAVTGPDQGIYLVGADGSDLREVATPDPPAISFDWGPKPVTP